MAVGSLAHCSLQHFSATDLRYIRELLDHKSSKTTEIYTHVTTSAKGKIRSSLEHLELDDEE